MNRCKVAPCFAWNDGKSCVASSCRFSHVCSKCGGDHHKPACLPPIESSPVPASMHDRGPFETVVCS